MSHAWGRGSTRRWREVRAIVLARDKYICRAHNDGYCDAVLRTHTCTRYATHAHHTKGKSVTGDDMRYIVASCRSCNMHIGDPRKHSPSHKRVSKW